MQAERLAIARAGQTLPGDADGDVPGRKSRRIAFAVALEGRLAAVKLVAVELDDHSLAREQRVDLEARHPGVHARRREPEAAAELQKGVLEGRAGRSLAGVGQLAQGSGAPMVGQAFEQLLQLDRAQVSFVGAPR